MTYNRSLCKINGLSYGITEHLKHMATLCKISLVKYNKAISKYENDVIIVL